MAYNRPQYVPRAPKRRIEKVTSIFNQQMTNSAGNLVLHTAEDQKTLVRVVGKLFVTGDTPGQRFSYNLTLQRAPSGTEVLTPATAQALDQDRTKEVIAEMCGVVPALAADEGQVIIDVDLAGMRKLSVGDEVTLSHIVSIANAGDLGGSLTLFFKE